LKVNQLKIIMKIQELNNKKIAILGYWLEWKSTAKFLDKLNLEYTILDKNIDKNYLQNLDNFDVIFKSPWISPYNNSELLKVKEKLTSQAEILADNFEWKIIWITGTKGKSTTSTLLYEILKELWYKVKLVWNIWNPVLDEIPLSQPFPQGEKGVFESFDFIIYELSSYMLEWLDLNIEIWLLNNIYDCHLDWHEWRENYENAKFSVFKNAKYKLAGLEIKPHLTSPKRRGIEGVIFFWNDIENFWIKENDIKLNWEHNYKNISGILNILKIIDSTSTTPLLTKEGLGVVKKVLLEFTGLEHRQENIWTYKNLTFINDAIASTPESAIAAIKTFKEEIWTIFIWNEDSGFDLTQLKETILKYKIKNIVLFPTTWEKLFWDFSKNMNFDEEVKYVEWDFETKLYKTLSMEEAVKFAYENTNPWKIVLLSTWAPSFNANWPWIMPWKWFIEKWNLFKKYVEKYAQ